MATSLGRVRALVERLSPEPICDDCVAQKLEINGRHDVDHNIRALAGTPGFERRKDICSLCDGDKIVIRRH